MTVAGRGPSLLVAAALAIASTACLGVPGDAPTQSCEGSSDCGAGGVCIEQLCYSDPASGGYGVSVTPPSERPELGTEEVALAEINEGWLPNLTVKRATVISGRVETGCEQQQAPCPSVAARLSFSRPSRISGGLPIVVQETSVAGLTSGSSFSARVPRTADGNEQYSVVVTPSGDLERSAPPLRMSISANADVEDVLLRLATANVLSGHVRRGADGVAGMRVIALGRWGVDMPPQRVSSLGFTDDGGAFTLAISPGVIGDLELVATPPDDTVGPTLHRTVSLGDDPAPVVLSMPTTVQVAATLQVRSVDSTGQPLAVAGAKVSARVHSIRYSPLPSLGATADYEVSGLTDDGGVVTLPVLTVNDGTSAGVVYELRVVPPIAQPWIAAGFGIERTALFSSAGATTLEWSPVDLGLRHALTGVIVDAEQVPVPGVVIRAAPASSLVAQLSDTERVQLAEVPATSATSNADGSFLLWTDPGERSLVGNVDLSFEPGAGSRLPMWVVRDLPSVGSDLGTITGPRAVYARMEVSALTSGEAEKLPGAAVRIYELPSLIVPDCSDHGCTIPPLLVAAGIADDLGVVSLILAAP
jgi:hypothetical protein